MTPLCHWSTGRSCVGGCSSGRERIGRQGHSPTFVSSTYGHVGSRAFVDLDVLVPREHLRRAREAMRTHGYRLASRAPNVFDRVFPTAWREDLFDPERPGLCGVEVHGALSTWALAVALDT